ncbi:MAG: hypothetical protein ACE361_08030 [Aureliella sp.]
MKLVANDSVRRPEADAKLQMDQAKDSSIRVAWAGPKSGCFTWVRQQIVSLGLELDDFADWDEVRAAFSTKVSTKPPVQRMLLACENRLELPVSIANGLPFEAEFPFGVITSDWWQGAVMSGNRQFPHPVFAWYRWWDSLFPWIQGLDTSGLMPAPIRHRRPYVGSLSTKELVKPLSYRRGLIAAGSRDAAASWGVATNPFTDEVEAVTNLQSSDMDELSSKTVALQMSENSIQPANLGWLLLDDSIFDSSSDAPSYRFTRDWIAKNRKRLTQLSVGVRCIYATSMPRWDALSELLGCGWDFIVKPTVGKTLETLLTRRLQPW